MSSRSIQADTLRTRSIDGIVVGEGDTFDEALDDVKSAIRFHVETFGLEALDVDSPVLEAVIVETAATG